MSEIKIQNLNDFRIVEFQNLETLVLKIFRNLWIKKKKLVSKFSNLFNFNFLK